MKSLIILFLFPVLYLSQENNSLEEYTYNILRQAIKNKGINHPNHLKSYQFYNYNKFSVESLSKKPDSLGLQELLFLGENVTLVKYDGKYGRKNTVLTNKIAGFSEPLYDMFFTKFSNEDFPGILTKDFSSHYFKLIDSTDINTRKTYVVSFNSKKDVLINGNIGLLYIDANDFSIVKYSGTEYREEYTRYFNFIWEKYKNIWHIKNISNRINYNPIHLPIYLKLKKENISFVITPVIIIESDFSNFSDSFNHSPKDFRRHIYEIDKNFDKDTERKIAPFRNNHLTSQETLTYTHHSFAKLFSLEKKINSFFSLKKGELTLDTFTLDLTNLISFNDYEGFRIQLGGKTNNKLDKDYSLHGYGAIGTKDGKFKLGGGIDFFINKEYDGKLSFFAASDVNPYSKNITRGFIPLEKVLERTNYTYNKTFYSYRKGQISYKQDFLKKFTVLLTSAYQSQQSKFHYSYNQNSPDHWFKLFTSEIGIRYSPFSEFMITPKGKIIINDLPVHFYLNYTKGWKELNSDFNFSKIDFSADLVLNNPLGNSCIVINSGYIHGKTTLWNNYGSFGNAKIRNSIIKKISPQGHNSFETMLPEEFFADKYFAIFLTHNLSHLRILNSKKTFLSLRYNLMIGDLKQKELHSLFNFQTPNKLYQEAGIELNKIFSNFGVGAYYRFGTYHLNHFEKNFFIKITFSTP